MQNSANGRFKKENAHKREREERFKKGKQEREHSIASDYVRLVVVIGYIFLSLRIFKLCKKTKKKGEGINERENQRKNDLFFLSLSDDRNGRDLLHLEHEETSLRRLFLAKKQTREKGDFFLFLKREKTNYRHRHTHILYCKLAIAGGQYNK